MMKISVLLFASLIGAVSANYFVYPKVFNETYRDKFVFGNFPEGFKWGLATAAYQAEGAWNVGGRKPSIWDTWVQTPGNSHNNETGDDACKSYYKWDDDVTNLQTMGVDFYRFSISWPRIIPDGKLNDDGSGVNMEGVKFYNDSINKIVAAGIEPYATLFHWDLPQALQDYDGGQTSPQFPQWYGEYVRVCFTYFGDRVKYWITFNEPQTVSNCYEYGNCAPGVHTPGIGGYQVIHNQLLGHAEAYRIYNEEFRDEQQGNVGITIVAGWGEPEDLTPKNVRASETANQFQIGWLLSPLLGTGNYPQIMIDQIGNASAYQGFTESRLPTFTPDQQKALLNGTDFVGLNYYTGEISSYVPFEPSSTPSMGNDESVGWGVPDWWPKSNCSWLMVSPYGIRNMLMWVQKQYGKFNTPLYITENGYCAAPNSPIPCMDTYDPDKTRYLLAHVNQVYRAITEDFVNLHGYTHWSLMDNFEWDDGYSKNFGLFCTDIKDPGRWRTPRYSAMMYNKIITNNGFLPEDSEFKDQLLELGLVGEI